jgi:glycosyltransferase involved in cell wall biosynthesis
MRCPRLDELPPLPPDKMGWPWTEESSQLPDAMPDGSSWPRVSIVTPSYNQAQFIEETIRSVLLQGYPDLEYIIIDGGSMDDSVEIIRKYEPWLAYWVSEKDRGQSHAINKGWKRASGEVWAWLNSDDLYVKGMLADPVVALCVEDTAGIAYGRVELFEEGGQVIRTTEATSIDFETLILGGAICQPGTFLRASMVRDVGWLNENQHYCFDFDLFLRLLCQSSISPIQRIIARYRLWPGSKTVSQGPRFLSERIDSVERAVSSLPVHLVSQRARFQSWVLTQNAILDALNGDGKAVERLLADAHNLYPHLPKDEVLLRHTLEAFPQNIDHMEKGTRFLSALSDTLKIPLRSNLLAPRMAYIHFHTADQLLYSGSRRRALRNLLQAAVYEYDFVLSRGFWSRVLHAILPRLANIVLKRSRLSRAKQ